MFKWLIGKIVKRRYFKRIDGSYGDDYTCVTSGYIDKDNKIITYQEVYVRLLLKVNGADEKKQVKLSKNISKLQEWFENELRSNVK